MLASESDKIGWRDILSKRPVDQLGVPTCFGNVALVSGPGLQRLRKECVLDQEQRLIAAFTFCVLPQQLVELRPQTGMARICEKSA